MYSEVRIMMSDEEKIIFEKAKCALIKLGKYSDDKENSDETKINDTLLERLLTSALIEMHSTFYKIDSYAIEDKESRRPHIRECGDIGTPCSRRIIGQND